jgi:uncharacterized protein (DUF1800 family)
VNASRRAFLAAGAAASGGLCACDGFYSGLSRRLAGGIPEGFARPEGTTADPDFLFLQRTGFGPAPGDLDRLRRTGREAWLEEQLHPERIDDAPCEILVRRLESLRMTAGDMHEFKREVAEDEIARATLLRAVYSRRQLFEVMAEFWSDHFNVFHGKGDCILYKTPDDRDVVRRHVFGRFRDLLKASALSPAMLVYLDGRSNRKGKPNENYARELLELHTLGVHGGYTQRDVMEVARALTGWDVRGEGRWMKGKVEFDPLRHDDGEKRILGSVLPAGGGEGDLDRVLDLVALHPSTARRLAEKLCRRLISDDPSPARVERVAARFLSSGGDLRRTTAEALAGLDEARPRFKRPFRFVVSVLRGLGAETQGKAPVREPLRRMGQAPFQHPTPDGYPDEPEPWLGAMIWRWRFALKVAGGKAGDVRLPVPVKDPSAWFPHLVGRLPSSEEGRVLREASSPAEGLATILAGPAFQWY